MYIKKQQLTANNIQYVYCFNALAVGKIKTNKTMKESVKNFAQSFLAHMMKNANLKNERVHEVIALFVRNNESEILRLYSYMTGFSEMPEVPQTSSYRRNATLTSYDFANNLVSYTYDYAFGINSNDKSLIDQFDGTVYDVNSYYKLPKEVRDLNSGQYSGKVYYRNSDRCSLHTWLQGESE